MVRYLLRKINLQRPQQSFSRVLKVSIIYHHRELKISLILEKPAASKQIVRNFSAAIKSKNNRNLSDPQYWKIMENFEKDIRCNTQKVREYLELENARKSVSQYLLFSKFGFNFATFRQWNKIKNKEKHMEKLSQTKSIMKNIKSEKETKRLEHVSLQKK